MDRGCRVDSALQVLRGVPDRERSLAFYRLLGFHIELEDDSDAIELINDHGVRINLIVNADAASCNDNALLDDPVKRPGHTHIAFIVSSLEDSVELVTKAGIAITEGPKIAERRRYFFIRDPDQNVLEFNELT
jgi:catechol 2,3-dioxygenase-like lactoylglutathione lyase family enzyme